MDPKNLSIRDYTYFLPEERIANYPLPERDASKLLIYKEGKITEGVYKNIADHIPENSLLIFNNTKVVEARLLFRKSTGGIIEIFCLEPHEQYPDVTTALLQKGKVLWQCLVGGASKWKPRQVLEKRVEVNSKEIILSAAYVEKRTDSFVIELSWVPAEQSFAEILHYAGAIPLPPYIKRTIEDPDRERYQTVYSHFDGSVAAPTAGLHFTDAIFKKLKEKNIQIDFVTLHIGAATFRPVKAETMQDHKMHAEFMIVSKAMIEDLLQNLENPVIAVGTTSLRSIESLYWLGVKKSLEPRSSAALQVSQWEAYELAGYSVSPDYALRVLLEHMEKHNLKSLVTKTQLLVAPGYEFKIVNALVTNFHQPQSTLLLLVAALIGSDWQKVYDHALQNNFRFLSYGDGNLLWAKKIRSSSRGDQ
jgi:S-adenosylmethionine:tRNA ribosyltransferase-isomerase